MSDFNREELLTQAIIGLEQAEAAFQAIQEIADGRGFRELAVALTKTQTARLWALEHQRIMAL